MQRECEAVSCPALLPACSVGKQAEADEQGVGKNCALGAWLPIRNEAGESWQGQSYIHVWVFLSVSQVKQRF